MLIAAEALSARVGGKVFRIKFADGSGARVDYKSNGYALLDTRAVAFATAASGGPGAPRSAFNGTRRSLGAARHGSKGDAPFVKRLSNGEIIALSE